MTQRYDTYKDSGVQWLGQIPGHWECVPLKYFIETKSGTAINATELDDRGTYPVYGGGSQIGFCNKYNCEESEIIVGRVGAKCGCVTFPNKKVWATDNALIIKTNLYPRFTAFVLEAADLNRLNAANAQPLITGTKIKKVRIALPEESEQRSIVSYLDSKCGMIDEWVTKKQKEVEYLQELKQRVIADAVTRGLNPHVKMKATNIPWLKEVPEHWENKRLAAIFTDDIETNKDFQYKRAFKFNYGCLVPKNEIGDPEEYRDVYVKYSIVYTGDILVNGLNLNYDFISQRVACAPSDGIITSAYVVCRPRQNVNYDYYTYLFKAMDSMKLFHGMGTGIRLTLSFKELKKQMLPVPPLEEQKQIVAHITDKSSKIDKLIANITKEIERIKEYKQRLISDAVTGQIKVC